MVEFQFHEGNVAQDSKRSKENRSAMLTPFRIWRVMMAFIVENLRCGYLGGYWPQV